MKKLYYCVIVLCYVAQFISFSSCSDDETVPIDLESISKVYKGEELRIFLNGEEYSSSNEEVGLGLPSMVSGNTKNGDSSSSEKMLLEILPLWPNIRDFSVSSNEFENLLIEVDAISTPEKVLLKGSYTDFTRYTLDVEGDCTDGVLTLNLTYTTNISKITGSAFVFNFDKESIDLSKLSPTIDFVEYDGRQMPVQEFVRDAMTPVFETIGKLLGGPLRIEFFSDGSTSVSIKAEGENVFTPVIGQHGYRFHRSNWGYLFADTEGATWMSELITRIPFDSISPLYGWRARNKYFMSVYYNLNWEYDLLMTLETPEMFQFSYFLSPWLDHFGITKDDYPIKTELSKEETLKCVHVINMQFKKQIKLICIKGVRE